MKQKTPQYLFLHGIYKPRLYHKNAIVHSFEANFFFKMIYIYFLRLKNINYRTQAYFV